MKRTRVILSFVLSVILAVSTAAPVYANGSSDFSSFFSQFIPKNVPRKPDLPRLVNSRNPLLENSVPELAPLGDTGYKATPETCAAFSEMYDAAKKDGVTLYICSAYRSYNSQNNLYKRKVSQLRGQYGDEVYDTAATIVARPGTSEHQLGQAIDFGSSLTSSFAQSKMGIWLANNAHKYGFILRYPEGFIDITGVIYEPWHFRYVGVEHSERIYKEGWVLEEYIDYMKKYG